MEAPEVAIEVIPPNFAKSLGTGRIFGKKITDDAAGNPRAHHEAAINSSALHASLLLLMCAGLFPIQIVPAAQVAVLHAEGELHGFLVLRTEDGDAIADGELAQITRGDRVTTRLVFRFKDGSINEETTVFTQRGTLRLVGDHLVQKGPSFKHPTDLSVNGLNGQLTVRYTDDNGIEKVVICDMSYALEKSDIFRAQGYTNTQSGARHRSRQGTGPSCTAVPVAPP